MYMNKNFLSTFKRVLVAAVVLLAAFLLIGCPEDTSPAAPTPPADPANLTVVFGDMQAELTWEAVENAVEYRIYRADTADGTLTRIAEDIVITDTSYVDTGLTNGTTYRYVIRAVSSAGAESGDSPEASTTPTPPPAAPTSLTATASDFQVTLSWDAVTDVTEYSVYRADTPDGTFSRIAASETINATTYTDADTGFVIDTAYRYVVRAVIRVSGSIGESVNSNEASATPLPLPAAPANLSATASGAANAFQVSLSWDAVTGATEYRIYRADTADGARTRVTTDADITGTTYIDTGLTHNTAYRYTVRAVDAIGESTDSVEASATTPALPAAPANLSATKGETVVWLSWDAVADATEYRIYRAATASGTLTRIASNTTVTAIIYTDTGLTNGTAYRYTVRAVDSVGESANSNEVSTTPSDHGNAPAAATPVTSGVAVGGNISISGDQDYFSIAVTGASSSAPVTIDAIPTGRVNSDGALFNSSGTQIGSDLYNGSDGRHFRIIRSVTEDGTYYIRVSGGGSLRPTGTYSLTITAAATAIDTDDHRNIRSSATAVTSGTAVSGTLNVNGDFDYFSIAVTGASSSSPVSLTASTTGTATTSGILFDSDGTQIAAGDSLQQPTDNFNIVHSITENGTYYIRVGGFANVQTGDYSLTVTTQ